MRSAQELEDFFRLLPQARFALAERLSGGRYSDGTAKVGIGPVFWRLDAPTLHSTVTGGGKISLDCNSGLFARVLLGGFRNET